MFPCLVVRNAVVYVCAVTSERPARPRRLLKFPTLSESPETQGFIDRYLELADKLLTPNLERERPEEKTESYHTPKKSQS